MSVQLPVGMIFGAVCGVFLGSVIEGYPYMALIAIVLLIIGSATIILLQYRKEIEQMERNS